MGTALTELQFDTTFVGGDSIAGASRHEMLLAWVVRDVAGRAFYTVPHRLG